MNLSECKKHKNTLLIEEGKRYKNFDGYYRDVLAILETSEGTKVHYIDDTNTKRTVKIDSFRQWVKKNYY